jgi:hypothetical protein
MMKRMSYGNSSCYAEDEQLEGDLLRRQEETQWA